MPNPLALEIPSPDCSQRTAIDHPASDLELGCMQRTQYRHDMRNHLDILALHKLDRLKHYGLHFAKYVGRIARDPTDRDTLARTVVDTLLISLSAANTLHQDLDSCNSADNPSLHEFGQLRFFADAAGRFADACEKIDHLEDFVPMARVANLDILEWVTYSARSIGLNLASQVQLRREQLARRQFFIE